MLDQIFSLATILSLVGVLGFRLAGKKVWWAWYVNIACQVLWVIFAISIEQYGLLIGVAFYTWVFGKNAYEWTMDHRDPMRGFDFNEVATAGIDRGPHPEFNMGFHIRDSEVGEDDVRVITDAKLMSVNLVDKPLHPSWTIESVSGVDVFVPPKDKPGKHKKQSDPIFKYRGEVPDESALSYRPEDLLETGRELASQREDLIAQGVDPNDLKVPIAMPFSFQHPDGRVCAMNADGEWITKVAGTEGPMNLGQKCGRLHDFDGD